MPRNTHEKVPITHHPRIAPQAHRDGARGGLRATTTQSLPHMTATQAAALRWWAGSALIKHMAAAALPSCCPPVRYGLMKVPGLIVSMGRTLSVARGYNTPWLGK